MKPINMAVSTPYGRKGPYWTACGFHTGDDFAVPLGTRLVAAIAGTIRHRNYGKAFGRHQFAISPSAGQPFADHEVFYAHTRTRLPDGTEVQMGDFVAESGDEGNVSGPHLHFEYHTRKNVWNCGVCVEPQPIYDHQSSGGGGGGGNGPYVTANIYSDKLGYGEPTNGDDSSDTVKELQERLNRIKLQGGANLPVTGNFLTMTDAEVRKWQEQIVHDPADPAGKSFLGPAQRAAMFPSPPYTIHDRGLPRVAGGGGWTPPPVQPPTPPPAVAWFAAPSLLALKAEIDSRWPNRDKSSDGTIGDYQHSTSKSEHNPVGTLFGPEFGTPGCVHAIDITTKDIDAETIIAQWLLRDPRVWYVIHKARIWSKTCGWEERKYTGSNPHNTHFHVSLAADDQAGALRNEADTAKWEKTVVTPPPVTPPDPPTPPPPPQPGDYITREEYEEHMDRIGDAFKDLG